MFLRCCKAYHVDIGLHYTTVFEINSPVMSFIFRLQNWLRISNVISSAAMVSNFDNPSTSYRIGKPTKCENTPRHAKRGIPRQYPFRYPPEYPPKYENRIFGVFFWYFRGIFSIPCCMGNLSVGLVILANFGVCGVFCSAAGSWVLKSNSHFREETKGWFWRLCRTLRIF